MTWTFTAVGTVVIVVIALRIRTKTKVNFTVGGTPDSLVLHGLPYQDGVILADPRHPARARCVSSSPYDLERDAGGNWIGRVTAKVWIGMICTLALWAAWITGVVLWQQLLVVNLWVKAGSAAGGAHQPAPTNRRRPIAQNLRDAPVDRTMGW